MKTIKQLENQVVFYRREKFKYRRKWQGSRFREILYIILIALLVWAHHYGIGC